MRAGYLSRMFVIAESDGCGVAWLEEESCGRGR